MPKNPGRPARVFSTPVSQRPAWCPVKMGATPPLQKGNTGYVQQRADLRSSLVAFGTVLNVCVLSSATPALVQANQNKDDNKDDATGDRNGLRIHVGLLTISPRGMNIGTFC